METSSQNKNCQVPETDDQEEVQISQKESATTKTEQYIDTAELRNRIGELHKELTSLRGKLAARTKEENIIESGEIPDVRLDENLQKQVLMLTEAMPHMVWIADSEGRTVFANERFHEFSGMTGDKDDGFAWVSVLHPEDLDKAMDKGNQAALENRPFSMEVRVRSSEGEFKWHLMHSIPFYDPGTNSTKWFGTTTCIDEQIRAREELKHSESKYRTMADAIPQIVFIANADGSIQFWNHRFYEFSGFTEEQSLTDAWQLLIHEKDLGEYIEQWKAAILSGDTFEKEFRLKRGLNRKANGDTRYLWHLARAVALTDMEDRTECWFGTWTDINDQKTSRN